MDELELFPVPSSGQTVVQRVGPSTIEVIIGNMNTADYNHVLGFFMQMKGRVGAFRFVYGSVVHPHCRFDTDGPGFEQHGPDSFSVTLPIKILSPRNPPAG